MIDPLGEIREIKNKNANETFNPATDSLEALSEALVALLVIINAINFQTSYTEDSVLGNSEGDGAWHDALDVDSRGMKSFSAVVENIDAANSLNWRLRARPSNYTTGDDEEIPECPGLSTLAPSEKGLVELIKSYSRVKIQVQDTVGGSPADYSVDYLINR